MSNDTPPTLSEMHDKVRAARATLFVCIQALDTGDDRTDLEQLAATTLRGIYGGLEETEDDLSVLIRRAEKQEEQS